MEKLINQIKSLADYKITSFYVRHLPFPLWRHFGGIVWKGMPNHIEKLCNQTKQLIHESSLKQNDILHYIANSVENPSYFFVAKCILRYGTPTKISEAEKYSIVSGQQALCDEDIDKNILACAVTSYVLDTFKEKLDLKYIIQNEEFNYSVNDYKLTNMNLKDIEFMQDGFIYDNKYYLYNIFINRKPLEPIENIPAVFKIISNQISTYASSFYLRLDERLAMPLASAHITSHLEFDLFRGFSFDFDKTNLHRAKEHIVMYNPETMDKLLWVIKQDYDYQLDQPIWHIEIEELRYIPDNSTLDSVLTSFIHALYYPSQRVFTHIDYTKNLYLKDIYIKKHKHSSHENIPINYYAEKDYHYKIWCLESKEIPEQIWYELVTTSLKEPFTSLFNESFKED